MALWQKILNTLSFVRRDGSWLPASVDEAQGTDSADEARAGALVVAEKRA